jgi:hypothetical protein
MTTFQSVAGSYVGDASFHLLYVGDSGAQYQEVLATVRDFPGRCRVARADALSVGPESAKHVAERDDLFVFNARDCLIVVLDLNASAGQVLSHALEEIRILDLSTQSIWFVLTPRVGLSFRDFVASVAQGVAGCGSLSDCVDCLRRWYGQPGGPEIPPDLRLPISKLPSEWLPAVGHDYLRATAMMPPRSELEAAGIWQEQRLLKVWWTLVQRVLVHPWTNYPLRKLREEGEEDPTEAEKLLNGAPPLVLVPVALAPLATRLRVGVDFQIYTGREEAERLLVETGRQGGRRVIVRAPLDTIITPPDVPTVFLIDDSFELSWRHWQEAFSQNVLGAFTVSEFLRLMPESRRTWGAFCLMPLARAVDLVMELLLQTHAKLAARPDLPGKEERLALLFRLAAQVWCARGLYFGAAKGGSD